MKGVGWSTRAPFDVPALSSQVVSASSGWCFKHEGDRHLLHSGSPPKRFFAEEPSGSKQEASLHTCNYTALIDNVEKQYRFGVRWSAALGPVITSLIRGVSSGFS